MARLPELPKRLVHADPDLAALIPRYLESRREELATLTAALARADHAAIAVIGHRLKGTGSSYGFEGLTEIGARLEEEALAGASARIENAITELGAYLDSLVIIYPRSQIIKRAA